jgi:hypothetical protein
VTLEIESLSISVVIANEICMEYPSPRSHLSATHEPSARTSRVLELQEWGCGRQVNWLRLETGCHGHQFGVEWKLKKRRTWVVKTIVQPSRNDVNIFQRARLLRDLRSAFTWMSRPSMALSD